ncbi:protein PFC0760c-like [Colias croceus]|uniref:protein PFC0760c-like n=1 Tax=Colias crocea TaxID=72248 RepID=UPI001E27C7F7|nr:protein PFC0760c-like [Colias croceus]
MASKRSNSTAIKGNASKRARSSRDDIQINQQLAEKEKSNTENGQFSSIDSETASDSNSIEGSENNTDAIICSTFNEEPNHESAEFNLEQSKTFISEKQDETNHTNDLPNISCDISNSHSEQEQANENNEDFNANNVGYSLMNGCTDGSVNSNILKASTSNAILYPEKVTVPKETITSFNSDNTKLEMGIQLNSDLMQREENVSAQAEDNSNSMTNTDTASLSKNDEGNESSQCMENVLIMKLQQRNDSEYWYPSKFESGINALRKLFTSDDDIEINENSIDVQKPSDTNNNDTAIGQSNVSETESNNQISNSDNLEIFDDRSESFETNIDDIMNDSEIWSAEDSPRFDYYLGGVNHTSLDNEEDDGDEDGDEENGDDEYDEDEYAEEEYETGSNATEELTEDSDDSDNESQHSEPGKLTRIKSKVIEMYKVDVKAEETPDKKIHENLTVERTFHSIENAAKLRKLRRILENNSIPRPLERGASKFNMVLGEIPDIIEVLRAYPDSSHHAHVRFINPEQENCQSTVGDVYIRNEPRKVLSDCSICLLTFCGYPVSTFCGHVFCENCLERTLTFHKQCPTCRTQLRKPYYHKIFI